MLGLLAFTGSETLERNGLGWDRLQAKQSLKLSSCYRGPQRFRCRVCSARRRFAQRWLDIEKVGLE